MSRGQAALEFLVTYGWAFLVLLVMIGALAYFGVINPNRFLPEKCIASQGFSCTDHYLSLYDGLGTERPEAAVVLQNSFGRPVIILAGTFNITCPGCDPAFNDCGTNTGCPVLDWKEPDDTRPNNPGIAKYTNYTLKPDATVRIETNPGGGGGINFLRAGDKQKVFISFKYRFLDSTYAHPVYVDLFTVVQEQKCGMRRCLYPAGFMTC